MCKSCVGESYKVVMQIFGEIDHWNSSWGKLINQIFYGRYHYKSLVNCPEGFHAEDNDKYRNEVTIACEKTRQGYRLVGKVTLNLLSRIFGCVKLASCQEMNPIC